MGADLNNLRERYQAWKLQREIRKTLREIQASKRNRALLLRLLLRHLSPKSTAARSPMAGTLAQLAQCLPSREAVRVAVRLKAACQRVPLLRRLPGLRPAPLPSVPQRLPLRLRLILRAVRVSAWFIRKAIAN